MSVPLRPLTGSEKAFPISPTGSWFSKPETQAKVQEKREQRALIPAEEKPLTAKQKRFVFEYLADPRRNAAGAARKAGYSDVTSQMARWNILSDPRVQRVVEIEEKRIFTKLQIDSERVIQNIATIAFANVMDYVKVDEKGNLQTDIRDLTIQQGIPIQELRIDVEGGKQKIVVKLVDKLSALTLLGRHLKIFSEQPQNNFVNVTFLDKLMAGKASMAELGPGQLPITIFDSVSDSRESTEADGGRSS